MRGDFKLTGLSREKSMTCEPLHNQETFWPKVGLSQDRFDALWNYKKDNWGDKMIAEIEYSELNDQGIPIDGIVVGVKEVG